MSEPAAQLGGSSSICMLYFLVGVVPSYPSFVHRVCVHRSSYPSTSS